MHGFRTGRINVSLSSATWRRSVHLKLELARTGTVLDKAFAT